VRRTPFLIGALALGLVASACGSGTGTGTGSASPSVATPTAGGGSQVNAIVASVDLYASAPQRVGVGLLTNDNHLVSYGTVDFAFAFIGTTEQPQEPEPGPTATASFVPTPGMSGEGEVPTLTLPSEARGIYEAQGVTFDRAGYWTVTVTADVEGAGPQMSKATLAVNEQPALPAPGQPALATENLTMASKDAPRAAIDSRFTTEGTIPDPELHDWTVARALEEGRPVVLVFGTPVYCVSQFCGPVTDMIQQLSHEYADRAVFIHIEIWRDYQNQVINEAAADWLYRNADLTEPWLFLIDAHGTIVDRWSSLWTEDEVRAWLDRLPPMKR
jgi:hypothetical protein